MIINIFNIPKTHGKIKLRITTDYYYKLYINSKFVGQGFAQGYPLCYYWNEYGVTKYVTEGAVFEFTVEHIGPCTGTVEVNESIIYDDKEENKVYFPSPTIDVDCGIVICPEGEPASAEVEIEGCDDTVEFDAGDISLEGLGRIVQLDVTLRNVCPNKRVALAVLLYETDDSGCEHKRGMKTMTVPAHTRQNCHDVIVRCVKFVLPEDLDVSSTINSICNERHFKAKFIAHYIDDDIEFILKRFLKEQKNIFFNALIY